MKTFTAIRGLGRTDLESLVAAGVAMRNSLDEGLTPPKSLENRCVANLFFEPSTRTRLSFDLAAQRLGAHVVTLDPESSSTVKGESLQDTVMTVAGIGADILVVRHHEAGTPQTIADWTGLPVINAGDGVGEHPTQALLDAVTLHRRFGSLGGLRMTIVGDVVHSRVAGSLIHAMPSLGVDLTLVAPPQWLPADPSVRGLTDLDEVLTTTDVLYLLRVQTERGGVIDDAYVSGYGMNADRASRMREASVVMHAGPLNRGVEISDDVAESPRSLIGEQVRNGVPTRMAVLQALAEARQ
ncbi:MAG: aspartate carbamoyltransferase catalytic subunit [Actinomycetota bacterium]